MSQGSFTYTETFTVVSCYKCAVEFGMPAILQTRRVDDGESFWCPNGHCQHYTQSTIQKLEKQLRDKQETVDYYVKRNDELYNEKTHAERQAAARKGQVTKIKNRVAKGVCPCCNRQFEDLARHMESKHPDYATID